MAAKQAFAVLFDRFKERVTKKSEVVATRKGLMPSDVLEIVENTFKRFYKYPKKFDPTRRKDCDEALKFYLYGIAQRECTKLYCKRMGIGVSPYTGNEEMVYDFPEIPEGFSIPGISRSQLEKEREILELALGRHSWKHKVIYLTYKFVRKEGHNMPRPLLKEMREELGLGQGTINTYLKEITDTMKDYLEIYGKKEK